MTASLVTGASAGIGACFARQLAAEGNNLVLVARDETRLNSLATDLQSRYNSSCEVIVADLATEDGANAVAHRLRQTENPIDLVINNAGISSNKQLWDAEPASFNRIVDLNIRAVVQLTYAAIPGMLTRGKGGVINMSSMAGLLPDVQSPIYGATKAFVTAFSEAIAAQLAGKGVTVSAVCPGFTHTEFHDRADIDVSEIPGILWSTAEDVAATALREHRQGKVVIVPGIQYKAALATTRLLPRAVTQKLARKFASRT